MKKTLDLRGKRVRLFFHTDLDGTIAAVLIKLFSGAYVVEFKPTRQSSCQKPPSIKGVLDVFVDCRSKHMNEDVRIDHHASGESKSYLRKPGIILDTGYHSAASLVAHYLRINVNKHILQELDKADSGKPNAFRRFFFNKRTVNRLLTTLQKSDFQDFEVFKDKVLNAMEKGFAIEDIDDIEGYERTLKKRFHLQIEEIKREGKPLVKFIHSKDHGLFSRPFSISAKQMHGNVTPFVHQHYYEESKRNGIGIYAVFAFTDDNKDEKYELFVARSHDHAIINIGTLIQQAKQHSGITNGGGRDSVGGMNTNDKKKGLKALRFIIHHIREHA